LCTPRAKIRAASQEKDGNIQAIAMPPSATRFVEYQIAAHPAHQNRIYTPCSLCAPFQQMEGETMRSLFAALFSVALLLGAALSQQTPETRQQVPTSGQPTADHGPASNPLKIAPGSVIPVQVSKTIDAKKAKAGDEVVATVTRDMTTTRGDVVVPKDTKVIGHVTEVQARNKEQKQSELGIAFDRAIVKGDQMQLPMSIQAVIAPPPSNPGPGGPESPAPAPSASAPMGTSSNSPMGGSRQGGTNGTSPSGQAQQNYPQGSMPSESQSSANRPAINGNTQGVIGMSDVKLESGSQNSEQGSVLTSEKSNVKIEKGTMLLLRVNQ
jgi:hypothetical protein